MRSTGKKEIQGSMNRCTGDRAIRNNIENGVKHNLINHTVRLTILTHSHTMTPFDAHWKQAFENTVRKGEIARDKQFLLFPQCFLPVWITLCHFCQIVVCKLFQFGRV